MPVLTEDRRTTAHYIVSEASNIYRSREQVMITGAAPVKAGTVLGRKTAASADAVAAADADNAANPEPDIFVREIHGTFRFVIFHSVNKKMDCFLEDSSQ